MNPLTIMTMTLGVVLIKIFSCFSVLHAFSPESERKNFIATMTCDTIRADFLMVADAPTAVPRSETRPGPSIICNVVGIVIPYSIGITADSFRVRIFEVECTGLENPVQLYDSEMRTMFPNNPSSPIPLLNTIGWPIGIDSDTSRCYFFANTANGNTWGKCYKWVLYLKNECFEDEAYSYFQVNPNCPVLATDFQSNTTQICAGSCVNFQTILDLFPEFHSWSFPGGIPSFSNMQNPQSICYPIPGRYSVTLSYRNCFNSDTLIKTDYIEVLPAPQPIGPPETEVIILLGDTVTLEACATGDTYFWSPPAGLSCSDCPSPLASPNLDITYTLIVETESGCRDTCHYGVRVGQLPVAAFSSDARFVCEDGCVRFDFSGDPGNVDTFFWHFPGGEPSYSVVPSPGSICYPAAGKYPVLLAVRNAFGVDTLTFQDFITVTPRVDLAGDTIQPVIALSFGDSIRLSACATGNTYSWTPLDGLSCTDCPSPVLVAINSGTYTVEVSNNGECAVVCRYAISVSTQDNIYLPGAFSPNDDGINDVFTAYGPFQRVERLQVFNRWGGLVWDNPNGIPWNGTFNGRQAEPGLYVYLLRYTDTRTGAMNTIYGEVMLMR